MYKTLKRNRHIVSIVFNNVEGDSRVIKTAQAAMNSGYEATIVGVTNSSDVERKLVEGVRVMLLPNYTSKLKKQGLWEDGNKDLRLLIGGYLRLAIPEIIALKPDLLHSHDMIGLKIGGATYKSLLASGRSIPWIHDLHEFVAGLKGDLADSYMPVCLEWEREFLHLATHLISVSDALAAEIQDRYNLPSLPTVTYNTPNASKFSNSGGDIRATLGLSNNTPLVVFVGGANQLRGCDTIVEAVARLADVHLVFVSKGKYVDELTSKATALGMGKRFHVHPYVPSDQVTTFIRTADVGIHALIHYPNAEVAMPNKMFEYMHAGLPLAVSDVSSMKAFVETHGIGLAFEAGNSESCCEIIKSLFVNRDSFRSKITPELMREYSWEQQEKKIQSIYNHLMETTHLTLTIEKRQHAAAWEKMEAGVFESIYARALLDAAIKRWERMLAVRPDGDLATPKQATARLEKARLEKAAALRKSGNLEGAEALVRQSLDLNTTHLGALTQWAELASARKEWDEAIKRWERVLAVSPYGDLATPKQATARLEKARLEKAAALRKSGSYMRQFVRLLRKDGWKVALSRSVEKLRAM